METPKKMSPEELAEINKSRIMSDAELVKGGAEVSAGGVISVTDEQINSAKLEMGEDFYKQNKELQHKELELKLALVRKEIEAAQDPNWYQKEYEGWRTQSENRKTEYVEAEEFIKNLPDEDKNVILSHYNRMNDTEMRYKAHLAWVIDSGMGKKYGAPQLEKVSALIGRQRDLQKYLREKERELVKLTQREDK